MKAVLFQVLKPKVSEAWILIIDTSYDYSNILIQGHHPHILRMYLQEENPHKKVL